MSSITLTSRLRFTRETLIALGLALLGGLLWWACRFHATSLPVWAPWDFSPAWYLAFAVMGWSYARGLRRKREPLWRIALFILGAGLIWAVLQTHFEYSAQHMFFLNRIQHVAMHHLGPFFIALAWPWPTLYRGMPGFGRRMVGHPLAQRCMKLMQQPDVASLLFVGLIGLWLWPPIHFVAMINPLLYQIMNWSMVIDGVLFWSVVLDPRPADQAHNSFGARAAMGIGVMFPQIALGAVIAYSSRDIYAFYAWCGRLYPSIDAIADQRIGGLIVWIPPAMMSVLSLLLVLNFMRMDDDRQNPPSPPGSGGTSSASWTGR